MASPLCSAEPTVESFYDYYVAQLKSVGKAGHRLKLSVKKWDDPATGRDPARCQ